jgi:hypothetical protein
MDRATGWRKRQIQKEWIGLTPEEREMLKFQCINRQSWTLDLDEDAFAVAVEEKLREKNS